MPQIPISDILRLSIPSIPVSSHWRTVYTTQHLHTFTMSSHAAEHDDIGDLIRQTIFALGGGSAADAEAAKERVEAARTAIR